MTDQDPEPATWADVRETFRRKVGWSTLITVAWIGTWMISLRQLRAPDLAVAIRMLWCLAPLPFMGAESWLLIRRVSRSTELERRVTEQAAGYALVITIALYMALGLVNMAFPISAEDLAWGFMIPVLTYELCWMRLYRRFVPR